MGRGLDPEPRAGEQPAQPGRRARVLVAEDAHALLLRRDGPPARERVPRGVHEPLRAEPRERGAGRAGDGRGHDVLERERLERLREVLDLLVQRRGLEAEVLDAGRDAGHAEGGHPERARRAPRRDPARRDRDLRPVERAEADAAQDVPVGGEEEQEPGGPPERGERHLPDHHRAPEEQDEEPDDGRADRGPDAEERAVAVRLLDAGEVDERLVVEPDEGRGVGEHHREHLGVEGADGEEPGQVRDRRPEEEEADEHPAAGEDEEHRQVQDERQGGADQHVALHRAVVLDGEEVGADEVRPAAERDEVVVDGAHALVVERRRAAVHVQLGAGPRGAARPPDEPRQERGPQPGGIGLDGREVRVAAREPGDGERLVGAPPDGLLAEEGAEVLRREERRELEEPSGGGGLEERAPRGTRRPPGAARSPRAPRPRGRPARRRSSRGTGSAPGSGRRARRPRGRGGRASGSDRRPA